MEKPFKLALEARENAYTPYAKYKVGAAVKAVGHDEIFTGCNIENASFGATLCAERAAMCGMISKLGGVKIEYLLLVAENSPHPVICGECLQFMEEFSTAETKIHLANLDGIQKTVTFKEAFPFSFNGDYF